VVKFYVQFAIADICSETPFHSSQSSQIRGSRSEVFGPQLHRDTILLTATEILGHVVTTYAPEAEPTHRFSLLTFPTVDFRMTNSQRLAVGTSEGAIVMDDCMF
jgi:hypothetical protein